MPESPEEKAALEKLDQATREVAAEELQKEADREATAGWWNWGSLKWLGRVRVFRRVKGDPVLEPVHDPDPGDERGLRDVLDSDEKNES